MTKRRFAVCGLSVRAIYHFALPLVGREMDSLQPGKPVADFSETAVLVGLLDLDAYRINEFLHRTDRSIPAYGAGELTKMIRETRPDTVLIATPDYLHCENAIEAMAAGCDVVIEKPMVISSEEAIRLREAEAKFNRKVTVAFNYRYSLRHQLIRKLIAEGRIGKVTSVEFVYNLGTFHGSSYFYRWNRERAKSGGLNIHKCCHHFDLVNWFLDDLPETVFAFGALNYYGPQGALRPRDPSGKRLAGSAEREACPIFQKHYATRFSASDASVNTGWDALKIPYPAQYPTDEARYIYDDVIDVEDTYTVTARYSRGALLSYSCNFCTPWGGYILGINGTEGRIEAQHRTNPDPTGLSAGEKVGETVTLRPLFGPPEEIPVPEVVGGHDGADPLIQKDIFSGVTPESAALQLLAGSEAGAIAVATGEAVWKSIHTGLPIHLNVDFFHRSA